MIKSNLQTAPAPRNFLMAGAMAALALAALAFAGGAQARSDVQFSVGVVIPGVQVGVSNAYPVYPQPVYHPQPVYYPAQPVYVQPQPVYYQPRPVFVQRAPVYVVPGPGYHRGHKARGHGHGHGHGRGPQGRHGYQARGNYR